MLRVAAMPQVHGSDQDFGDLSELVTHYQTEPISEKDDYLGEPLNWEHDLNLGIEAERAVYVTVHSPHVMNLLAHPFLSAPTSSLPVLLACLHYALSQRGHASAAFQYPHTPSPQTYAYLSPSYPVSTCTFSSTLCDDRF